MISVICSRGVLSTARSSPYIAQIGGWPQPIGGDQNLGLLQGLGIGHVSVDDFGHLLARRTLDRPLVAVYRPDRRLASTDWRRPEPWPPARPWYRPCKR